MGAIHHVPAGSGPCITYGGQVINLKVTAAESGGEVMIMEDAIAAGGGPPLHVHERENEGYYVLEGEFEFVCGDDRVTGGPGTFVFATRGVPHRYRNIGASTGRMLFTFTPAGIEAFFTELGNEPDLTRERMAEIMRTHGIMLVPEPT
jgi:mannose-6-phosphate isomerase-like protein (cupin superfamily)